uniref:Uncharacterized protein n=1 Tax=Glossina austeni TaxID=7395 RepID=A0A1A9UWD3_GLOAU
MKFVEIESTRIDKCVHAVPLSDTPVRTYRFHMTGTSKTILVSINFLFFNEPSENEQQIFSDFHMHTHTYRHCITLPLQSGTEILKKCVSRGERQNIQQREEV